MLRQPHPPIYTTDVNGLVPNFGAATEVVLTDTGWMTSTDWAALLPVSPLLTDGDKGDITVGGGATTLTIDNDAVTFAKMQNATQACFVGATGAGNLEERTYANARSDLGLVIGTNVQAWDAQLDSLAGLGYAGNTLKVIRVDAGETGFELATISASSSRTIGVTFDGGGSPPTVGSVGYFVCQHSGTIDRWNIVADQSGSAVVDVWKAAGSIPTNGDTITGSEKPTLAAQQLNSDTSLSTWTTAVAVGDVFGFEIESVSTCTRLTVEVRIS